MGRGVNPLKKKEIVFLILSIAYFFGGLFGSTAVSGLVVKYIQHNGWGLLRYWTYHIGAVMIAIALILVFLRLWFRLPTPKECIIAAIGTTFTIFVITHFVLLTTEIIHIPQFMFLTVLFLEAFPRNPQTGLLLSQIACIGDEWSQSMLPGRVLDINDIFLNFIGMFIGMILWWAISIYPLKPQAASLQPNLTDDHS